MSVIYADAKPPRTRWHLAKMAYNLEPGEVIVWIEPRRDFFISAFVYWRPLDGGKQIFTNYAAFTRGGARRWAEMTLDSLRAQAVVV